MKQVQHPRGTTEQEDAILGAQGQIRVDVSRNELRLHDGVTVGGHRIPSESTVQALIAQNQGQATGRIQIFATVAELQAAVPSTTTVALCVEEGLEAWFTWTAAAGDQTSVISSVSGSWKRLSSGVTWVMLFWRAGLLNLVVDSSPPIANQATTAWIVDDEVRLWNGSDYVAATPTLFAAMLAAVGGYSTESFTLPDRLQSTTVATTDCNGNEATGWAHGTDTTANRPADVSFYLQVYGNAADNTLQIAYEIGGNRTWIRKQAAGVWSAWSLIESLIGTLSESKIPALPISKITDLADSLTAAAPPGAVMAFARNSAPTGWLKANGAAVSRATYAALFAAIGTTFGAGDGTTTFNLPELRGEFIRGWDDSRGVDSGRAFGSAQAQAIQSHTHTASTASSGSHTHTASTSSAGSHTHTGTAASAGAHTHGIGRQSEGGSTMAPEVPFANGSARATTTQTDSSGSHTHSLSIDSGGAHTHTVTVNSDGAHTHTVTVNATGDAETRPRNIALLYCIKT